MITLNLMNTEIFVCTKEEAKRLWKEDKDSRSKLWLEDEVIRALPLGPKEISGIMEKKKSPGGYVYKE